MGCVKVLMTQGLTMALGLFWNERIELRWVMALLSMKLVLWNEKNGFGFVKWEKCFGNKWWNMSTWEIMRVDLENGKWNVNSIWVSENKYEYWTIVSWVLNTHIWGGYLYLSY